MSVTKAGGYISQLVFNNGVTVDIQKNDIVIFVGPNNAGKSQSLKDIYELAMQKSPCTVISDIKINKEQGSLLAVLEDIATEEVQGQLRYYWVQDKRISYFNGTEEEFQKNAYYGSMRNVFIANLDTSARLNICQPPKSISRNEGKKHPIHFAAFEGKYRYWLSANFKKAFDYDLIPNLMYGATVPLCMGDPVKLEDKYEDEQTRQEAYSAILETYKQVQNQGDGIKSFTGILLYLMLDYYHTYLIDEPESFLHPPQAQIMGQIIGEALSDGRQAFISTHSENIIKGLIDVCFDRVKIIRITRNGDTNNFSILDHEQLSTVWSDPLLRYSNIMSSLFHKTVVLCESDSDCRFYSIVEGHLKEKDGKYSETLFIHCGGKHRMAKIIRALRVLNVDVKLIPDIDVLDNKDVFKGIIEAFGIEWNVIEADYNKIVSSLHSSKERIEKAIAKQGIDSVFGSATGKFLSEQEITSIRKEITTISKWKVLKSAGAAALPAGDATVSFRRLNEVCKTNGIFIVPVGELECFIKEVGGHGPEWVNKVLETYPDLNNDVYSEVRNFIAGMGL